MTNDKIQMTNEIQNPNDKFQNKKFCHLCFGICHHFVICALVFVISGCGYTNKSLIAPGANTIFVETFQNKIDITKEPSTRQRYNVYKPFLETKITDAIINRFLYDGNLNIVDRASADLLLQGELVNYIRQPLKYS